MRAGGTAVVPSDEPLLEPWLRDDLEIVTLRPRRRRALRGLLAQVRRRPRRPADAARGDRAGRAGRARAAVRPAAQPAQHVGRAGRGAGGRGAPERRHQRPLLLDARRARGSPGSASTSSTTATTPTRFPCAPPWTILPRITPRAAASRCSATCSSSAPGEQEHHREIGAYAASAGVDLLVTVGPRAAAMLDTFDGESQAVADAGEAAALLPELVDRGRRRAGQGVARRRPRGRHRSAAGRRLMGEVLIAGTASLLMCIFLSPEVHRVPARARVRAAHPRGGAAGAPRQGGHADDGRDHHLHCGRGAVPAADRVHAARDRGLRRRARVRAARLRRRLHEDRQAAVAGPARRGRSSSPRSRSRSGCGSSPPAGQICPTRSTCGSSTPGSTSATCIRSSSTSCSRARPRRST